MLLIDANLLIYAWDARAPQHEAAREWLDGRLSEPARVALPWQSLLAFLRIVTNPRIYERPATVAQAWAQVEAWLDAGPVWVPVAGPRHRELLRKLLPQLGGGGDLIPDTHLAALALEHGLTLCSTDGDFARFEGLRWLNPLRRPW